jgi:signal transduction histidine kinase
MVNSTIVNDRPRREAAATETLLEAPKQLDQRKGKEILTSKMHDMRRGVPGPLTERPELREEVLPFVDVSKGALSGACAHFLTDDLIHQLVNTELHIRMEERANERTRIARDLHDTLLQSFQGVLLKLSTVCYVIRNRPADAAGMVERIVEQARQAVTEGRDAVLGLRSSAVVTNDLAKAITAFGEGLSSDQAGGKSPYFRVDVEGTSMDIAPLIRDEAYRIVGEALRNAFRHADARRIEVKIHYDEPRLRIMVQDDGRGIDAQFLSAGGRTGHHGLPGMYERAQLAGGKLIVWSELDSGTQIELSIPASVAYAKAPVLRMSAASGQGTA